MIRIHIRTLLFVIQILVLVAILIALIVLIGKIKENANQNSNQTNNNQKSESKINSPNFVSVTAMQSDFFKRSITHAENIINGNINISDYGQDRVGSDVVTMFMYLNENEKKSLLSILNYYQSDPFIFSETEREFRKISSETMMPLWLVIIQDAMKKSNIISKSNLKVVNLQ